MQDTVERLVQEELEREEAKGKARSQVTQLAQED